jgi:hypothetical protein
MMITRLEHFVDIRFMQTTAMNYLLIACVLAGVNGGSLEKFFEKYINIFRSTLWSEHPDEQ